MDGVTAVDEIEFLDVADASRGSGTEAVISASSSWRWLALGFLLVACVWFVTSTGADTVLEEPAIDTLPDEPLTPTPSPLANENGLPTLVPPVFGIWPTPPTERDPPVVRIPGPVELPSAIPNGVLGATTIVYVNTAGDPTVVSFETGDVSEVGVAAIRVHETFAVEAGRVVSLEGANAALDDASDQAFIFHTYRDVDRPGVGTMGDERGMGRGPELCLSGSTCTRPGLGLERMASGGLVAERFDPKRHWAIDDLLVSWEPVDRWLVSADGYRIPAPVGVMWVIGPPERGSSSSVGLL